MKLQTTLLAVAVIALLAWARPAPAQQQTESKAHEGAPAAQEGSAKVQEGAIKAHEGADHPQEGTAHDAPHDAHPGGPTTRPAGADHHDAHSASHDASHDAGPVPPEHEDKRWVGVMLILVATFFVLAAVIGPIVRAHAPPVEMPPTHSHDEPPGASHHHGSTGTINPDHGDHSHGHRDHGHH